MTIIKGNQSGHIQYFQITRNPRNRTALSSSGKSVNERSAMQMTVVYAYVRILNEAIAGLPLHLYSCDMDGSRKKAPIPRFRRHADIALSSD